MPLALPMDECDPQTGLCVLNIGRNSYITPAGAAFQIVKSLENWTGELIGSRAMPNYYR